jgi:L-threonylcarbamoyladenylate synthase
VTQLLDSSASSVARAAECLRGGGLVAFPTETVYGLGVHALDEGAVRRLFEAKGRPAADPLIVHVLDVAGAKTLVRPGADTSLLERLGARFWPGPLTLVLPKSPRVPDVVTAGLDTVAVRVPAHPVARALLEAAHIPVAAPSANLFSRPSPTRAEHVLHDLDGRIDFVIDAGSTDVGLESTVLDLSDGAPVVLRPGAVTVAMLREALGTAVGIRDRTATDPARSPGLLEKHYAPRTPLTLYEGRHASARLAADAIEASRRGERIGVLVPDEDARRFDESAFRVVTLGRRGDQAAMAARLYAALREADAAGADALYALGIDDDAGLGAAITDRLRRAAARVIRT